MYKAYRPFQRSKNYKTTKYVPSCNPVDGSYEPVQCFDNNEFCWCVDRVGRPIKKTGISKGRDELRCRSYGKY